MSQICRVCGKEFVALYPHLWAYRRGEDYYCSWKCLRAEEKGDESNMKTIVTKEQKQKAVSMAIDGKDPLEYLREIGSKSPVKMWYYIKASVRKSDPELYAKIPDLRKIWTKPEAVPVVKVDGAIRIETPEAGKVEVMETPEGCSGLFVGTKGSEAVKEPKISMPICYDGMMVREVEGLFGLYRRSDIGGKTYIDMENKEGLDTISMTVEQWRGFIEEYQKAARILWVEP